jgi:CTP synthase (UTP-ammonia lyase)
MPALVAEEEAVLDSTILDEEKLLAAPERMARIAIVGDFNPESETHLAIGAALRHAAEALGVRVESKWIATECAARDADKIFRNHDGLFISPGSPYRSKEGAFAAIRFARTEGRPLLGACAGFQHAVLEYARNVMGIADAESAEHGVPSANMLITAVACPMPNRAAGSPRLQGAATIQLRRGTRVREIYARDEISERYFCNFEVNPAYCDALKKAGLVLSGFSETGDVRVIELPRHPFFIATLFQPQLSSEPGKPHPLIRAFVGASAMEGGLY